MPVLFGMFFIVLFLGGLFLKEIFRREILVIGTINFAVFITYVFFARIHAQNTGDHVDLYSPLYTHKIEVCERIDTISLCTSLEANFDDYSGKMEDFYFLTRADADSTIIYNRLRKVMAINGEYEIIQRPFHGVMVNLIRVNNGVYSFDGTRVNTITWVPPIRDTTPFDPNM